MKLLSLTWFCAIITLMHNFGQTFIPYLVVAFIYFAVAADFWRGNKPDGATINKLAFKLHSAILALGLVVHGWLLYAGIFSQGFNLGFYHALSAILWLTVLIYWLADLEHQLHSLQAFVLPPAAVCALLPAFFNSSHFLPANASGLFLTHIGIALLAYGLFTFAALHGILMYFAEANLHNKPSPLKSLDFPPLMVMENLLFKVIGLGFILLTITLISGMLFSEQIFNQPLKFNHKTIFSIASWLIYGGLLFGRFTFGWRGKKAIRWTLIGFALLLLAYIGSKFILQVLLNQ
jgi:ABC-type uncharacterized transport system permease subunit